MLTDLHGTRVYDTIWNHNETKTIEANARSSALEEQNQEFGGFVGRIGQRTSDDQAQEQPDKRLVERLEKEHLNPMDTLERTKQLLDKKYLR